MTRPARLSPGPAPGWWWLWWLTPRGTVAGCSVDADLIGSMAACARLRVVAADGAEVVA